MEAWCEGSCIVNSHFSIIYYENDYASNAIGSNHELNPLRWGQIIITRVIWLGHVANKCVQFPKEFEKKHVYFVHNNISAQVHV